MKTINSRLSADDTVKKLLAGIEAQNMRVVAHINGQANAAKMGKQVPADQILEVFRPDFAIKVWDACKPAGIEIPLRIHIYEYGDAVIVSCREPSSVFAKFSSAELNEIGIELDAIFNQILAYVTDA